jgi:hypothetical protein
MPRATPVATVLAAAALLLACSPAAPTAPPTAPVTPSPPPPDPLTVCTNQLVYWAGQDLAGADGEGYDYQHRGLSSEQNDALTHLVEQARAGSWSPEQLAEQARTACEPIAAAQPEGY